MCDPPGALVSWPRANAPREAEQEEGRVVVVSDLSVQLCEICQSVGQHSPRPATLCCSTGASFRGKHVFRADAPAAAGAAGRGAEWSLCTRGWLGEAQGKLEVEG